MGRTSKMRAFVRGRGIGLAAAMAVTLAGAGSAFAEHSVAREWNETILQSIRLDLVRPPVQARNLFHLSMGMYDAWAAYDAAAQGYFFHEKVAATDTVAAQNEAVSYAAYRILLHRFAGHTAIIDDLDLDPSGEFLASTGRDFHLLIYRLEGDTLIFVRAGTHSELFEE